MTTSIRSKAVCKNRKSRRKKMRQSKQILGRQNDKVSCGADVLDYKKAKWEEEIND